MQTEATLSQPNSTQSPKAKWEEPRIEIEYSLVAQAQNPGSDPLIFTGPLDVSP